MPYQRDTLYDTPQAVVDFRFDERTAAVFPDMIHRSVPGYATLLQLFAVIGAGFVPEGGHVYDLGCALGGASIALQRHIPQSATIDAVDNAEAMTRRLAAYVEGAGIRNIRVQQADITALDYASADLIMGTGPYKAVSFQPDSKAVFEKSGTWWGGDTPAQTIEFDFFSDENARFLAQKNGTIDIATQLPIDQVSQFQGINGVSVLTESDRVFREQGVAAYREHQEKHKQKPAEHEEDERTIEH